MKGLFKKGAQAVGSAAVDAVSRVESSVTGFPSGIKVIRNYDIGPQIASGGPGLTFKIYSAQSKRDKVQASVWILDKRVLLEERKVPKAELDAFSELIKRGAAQMAKLHHPRILKVLEPLEESRSGLAFATEPVFATLANAMRKYDNLPKLPLSLREYDLRSLPLEMKHGILQVTEALVFLHSHANIIHRGISPEAIIITANTFDWKMCLFEFSAVHGYQQSQHDKQMFEYKEFDSRGSRSPWHLPNQPSLDFTAPELVAGVGTSPTSDMFSLGVLIYELYSGHPLLQSNGNILSYKREVESMARTGPNFSKGNPIPPKVEEDLAALLHPNPSNRLNAERFAASNFFIEDGLLRALKFLDHFLERETVHKSQFLQTLQTIWQGFEPRILQFKVIPPLLLELRNQSLRPLILPILLPLLDHVSKDLYQTQIVPQLIEVMATADGDSLLTMTREVQRLVEKSSSRMSSEHILPMLIRGLISDNPPLQEEALRALPFLARTIDYGQVKKEILPKIHAVATRTKHARVRICAIESMGDLASNLDKHTLEQMCLSLSAILKVDGSGTVVSAIIDVAETITEKSGIEIIANKILPMFCPIMLNPSLTIDEFRKLATKMKEMIKRIEDLRLRELGESAALREDAQRMIGDGGIGLAASTVGQTASWDNPNNLGFGQSALSDRRPPKQHGSAPAPAPPADGSAGANLMDDPFGIVPSGGAGGDGISRGDGGYHPQVQPAMRMDPLAADMSAAAAPQPVDNYNIVIPPTPAGWKPGQPVNLSPPSTSSSDPMFSMGSGSPSMDPYGMSTSHQPQPQQPQQPPSSSTMGFTPQPPAPFAQQPQQPQQHGMPSQSIGLAGPAGNHSHYAPPQQPHQPPTNGGVGGGGMVDIFGGMSLQSGPNSSDLGGGGGGGGGGGPYGGIGASQYGTSMSPAGGTSALFSNMSIAPPPSASQPYAQQQQQQLQQQPPPPMSSQSGGGGAADPFNLMG